MGVLNAIRKVGRVPKTIFDRMWEWDERVVPERSPSSRAEYEYQVTPEGETYQESIDLPGQERQTWERTRSNRPSKLAQTIGAMGRAAVVAGSMPSQYGGGPVDIFRGMRAASMDREQRQDKAYQQQRQAEIDRQNQQLQEAQIRQYESAAVENLAQADKARLMQSDPEQFKALVDYFIQNNYDEKTAINMALAWRLKNTAGLELPGVQASQQLKDPAWLAGQRQKAIDALNLGGQFPEGSRERASAVLFGRNPPAIRPPWRSKQVNEKGEVVVLESSEPGKVNTLPTGVNIPPKPPARTSSSDRRYEDQQQTQEQIGKYLAQAGGDPQKALQLAQADMATPAKYRAGVIAGLQKLISKKGSGKFSASDIMGGATTGEKAKGDPLKIR